MSSGHTLQLAKAVQGILRPLVRILIRFEFTHAELTELVRQAYVAEAYKSHNIEGQDMTVSRAAVLTGLSRKEVLRLKTLLDEKELSIKRAPNRAQRVVQGWLRDSDYQDGSGQPKVLPIKGKQGSFLSLVSRYSGDITYGAILEELNKVGVTRQPNSTTVELINRAYVPHQDDVEQMRIASQCAADLLNTSVKNIESGDEATRRFQRQVVYSHVEDEVAETFNEFSTEKAKSLMDELNQFLAVGRVKTTGKRTKNTKRVGMGIYYIEEPMTQKGEKGLKDTKS